MSLAELNAAGETAASALLRQCCTSERWIEGLTRQRPFSTTADLQLAADKVWAELGEADFLQAFAGHPKIGDVDSLKARYAGTKALAAGEQSGVDTAGSDTIEALALNNANYEQRFGFIFIVCASGKSAAEMLQLLLDRLHNSRDQELIIAAEEQRKIFQLRLEKLL